MEGPAFSQAEIADRITILELKSEYSAVDISDEIDWLRRYCLVPLAQMDQLREINREGWEAVRYVTEHFEKRKVLSDSRIIKHCRLAHLSNRKRVVLKNEITAALGGHAEYKTWLK